MSITTFMPTRKRKKAMEEMRKGENITAIINSNIDTNANIFSTLIEDTLYFVY